MLSHTHLSLLLLRCIIFQFPEYSIWRLTALGHCSCSSLRFSLFQFIQLFAFKSIANVTSLYTFPITQGVVYYLFYLKTFLKFSLSLLNLHHAEWYLLYSLLPPIPNYPEYLSWRWLQPSWYSHSPIQMPNNTEHYSTCSININQLMKYLTLLI